MLAANPLPIGSGHRYEHDGDGLGQLLERRVKRRAVSDDAIRTSATISLASSRIRCMSLSANDRPTGCFARQATPWLPAPARRRACVPAFPHRLPVRQQAYGGLTGHTLCGQRTSPGRPARHHQGMVRKARRSNTRFHRLFLPFDCIHASLTKDVQYGKLDALPRWPSFVWAYENRLSPGDK